MVSTATTSPAGTAATSCWSATSGSNVVRLGGTLPLGERPEELGVALEDPARYAATVFAEVLEARASA